MRLPQPPRVSSPAAETLIPDDLPDGLFEGDSADDRRLRRSWRGWRMPYAPQTVTCARARVVC